MLGCCQVDTEGLRKLHPVDAAAISKQPKLTEMDLQAVLNNDSTYLRVRGRASGRASGRARGWPTLT
jgi:hypothetical protein